MFPQVHTCTFILYTLRDNTTKSSHGTLKKEIRVLGVTYANVFQMQMNEMKPNKKAL